MWFFTTYFWINPPKSLIYSKKRGKSSLKFLFSWVTEGTRTLDIQNHNLRNCIGYYVDNHFVVLCFVLVWVNNG